MDFTIGTIWINSLSILVAIICIVIAYFKYSYNYWSRKGVYSLPAYFPYGSSKDLILQKVNFGEAVVDLYKKFKSKGARFAGFYVFSTPQLIIIDPELIKTVLTRDFSYFSDRGLNIDVKRDPIQGHLFILKGEEWKAIRQKLTPTFTTGKMKMMFQTIVACAESLEEILKESEKSNEEIDIKEISARYTTDIIGSCAFGLDLNSMSDSEAQFRHYGKRIMSPSTARAFKRIFARFLPNLFYLFNLKLIDAESTDFFMKAVADTVEYREKNNIKRNDFLQLLINIRNTGNVDVKINHESESRSSNGEVHGLSLQEITAHSFSFFLAGFETSSSTISFFIYDMCLHQDIQDKVREEINEMLARCDGKLTYEEIMELQYLDKALNESMRYHSGIPAIDRLCTKDYKIPGSDVIIEKGTAVAISLFGLHSDPDYYPEPKKFDPERFSKEEIAKRHPYTFLPFGEGPRVCIGQRFGLLQTKVGLVTLLKNYRFTLGKKTNVPLKIDPTNFIMQVIGGIWVNIERI